MSHLGLLDKIFHFFNKEEELKAAPDQVCPNCWGHQEYDHKIKEIVKDRQVDINNHQSFSSNAFIQEFVTNNIAGIHLKNEDESCGVCEWKEE